MTVLERLTTNPQTLNEIAQECGISRRDVELEINRLRLEGHPIVTDSDGARLARSAAEVAQCASRLRSRAVHVMETAQALDATARRMEAEQALTLWEAA